MKRIIIICEGRTEFKFCKRVLAPHFSSKHIYIDPPKIKKSGGGIVKWPSLKKQIENHLRGDKTAFVTTLIDFYGILEKHAYPDWDKAKKEPNKNKKMDILENGMKSGIHSSLTRKFIPYIQLHEFEGLLFNDIDVFDKNFLPSEMDRASLLKDIEDYPNPELVNDSPTNAPSKRLERYIEGYNKAELGAALAEAIGLPRIRKKSPRFNQWITKLEKLWN